ncbi:MAG: glycerol-3-phosphate 1-O-acyltransferase PlsY [Candidatus Margulisiibacteriota bacterium]|nr:glycerol-3-phosphate 1-O-acyltransferase PlsY [Candidatus Margulisiibacteriota bacterium]
MEIAVILITAYFIGSIPFSWIVARIKKVDLSSVGSGNIGSTNVFRALGPAYGGLAFFLDFAKGLSATYLAIYLNMDPLIVILASLFSVLGHTFSPFLKFKGGKGVATGLGALCAFAPLIFVIMAIYSAAMILITRYVSLTSVSGVIIASVLMFAFGQPLPYAVGTSLAAVYITIKHIPNIKRLLAGTESKIKL